MDLSVILMAYDEVESLEPTVAEILQSLENLKCSFEIVIVDDGSGDGTSELADALASRIPGVRVIHHPDNLGLGRVYRTGFREALGDCVTFLPADGQVPSIMLERVFPLLSECDMVLCYVPKDCRLFGRILSYQDRLIYRILLGSLPRYQGMMMFRRSILKATNLRMKGRGWAIVWELIIRARDAGYRITSYPAIMRPRAVGASKVQHFGSILANLRQVLALRHVLRSPTDD